MIRNLTAAEVDGFLAEAQFARLGCHSNGRIYVVPISYALDGERIVGQTTLGLKIELMRRDPSVCLEFDEVKDLANWKSVIATGSFKELHGLDAAAAVGLLIDKYGPIFEEMNSEARRGRNMTPPRLNGKDLLPVVYSISLLEKTGRCESPTP